VLRVDPSLSQENLQQPMDDASIELGAVYRSGAVRADDEPEAPLDDPRSRSWAAGTRAPHVDLGGGRSTVDVAGHGFAVLVDGSVEDWRKVADEAERELSVPVAVQEVQDDGLQGAALIRPDGVIAWRTGDAAAASDLTGVLRSLLHRSTS
jgi:aklavinone 12-hydroxylase